MDDNGTLADFLRAARGRVTPADIGLTTASFSVRRVPGLRRDEVAAVAGVSVDYYTRMEQGRVAHASDAVINALSSSLRLTETERAYLFSLLSASTGGRVRADTRSVRVRSSLRQMLDQMDNAAAFVLGVGMDVLVMKTMHPLVGRVDINYETFPVPGEPDQQLFVYTAATGSPSEDALKILSSWGKTAPATRRR